MSDYDPHLAWSLVRNRGLMEPSSPTGPSTANKLFKAYQLPPPREQLVLAPKHHGYRIWLCDGDFDYNFTEGTRGVPPCTVRARASVDRWSAFVVLLCEAMQARGKEAPVEMVACAALLLSIGAVEVLR